MRIAILGYGKMGKAIEKAALNRNHTIDLIIDNNDTFTSKILHEKQINVAINFSTPDTAYALIRTCFEANVPVVCGTTGWLKKFDKITKICKDTNQSFFYASNFSIGIFILRNMIQQIFSTNNLLDINNVKIEETHHTEKKDKPSGTAITLAEDIMAQLPQKIKWALTDTFENTNNNTIPVKAIREKDVFGIHKITFDSAYDSIEIAHTASNRMGFANGAVAAAEFIINKTGFFTMKDLFTNN